MINHPPEDDLPVGTLVRDAIDEARSLLRAEIDLARDELRRDVARARSAAVMLGAAAVAAMIGLTMLCVALALAIHLGWASVLAIGVFFLAGGGLSAVAGYRSLPMKPLDETRKRLEADVYMLKERTT